MKKAALYARVSSDLQQKERSIESQIAELKRQISKNGDKLVKEYVDDGYSGALLDRPAMNQLREAIRTSQFEVIYILNADRIARDVTYQNIIVGEILRYKKQLIINGKDYIHNPENKFTLTVLGAVSELERAKLIERTTRGRQYRLKQGHLMSNGWQTYGYQYTKKTATAFPTYKIIESEAKVIRYIFETYAKGGVGICTIVRQLEAMGVPKIKGRNCLEQTQIKHILKNEMYTGTRYFNSMTVLKVGDPMGKQIKRMEYTDRSGWIGIRIPAIISKELYDKVQVRLEYNRQCWRNSKRTQLLSNLVWCGQCESRCFVYRRAFQHKERRNRTTYRRVVYKCNNKGAGIHNPEINSHVLESCVWEMIGDTMTNGEKLYGCIDFVKRRKRANHARIERQLKDIDTKIQSLSGQRGRIVDLYASGALAQEEYQKRTSKYETNIQSLRSNKTELLRYLPLFQDVHAIQGDVYEYSKNIKEQFSLCSDFDSKRKFLLDYISKITFYRKSKAHMKVSVYGTIPITVQAPESQTIPVEFKIERIVDWHEIQVRTPKESPEDDILCRAPASMLVSNKPLQV